MSAPAKGKRPHKKPLNKLEAHEIAEIDKLIEIRHWQQQEEGRHLFREDEEELQRLMRVSPETPWPQQPGPGVTSGGDGFHYVREADGLPEAWRGNVVEVARRDGMIRYALAPGDGIDTDQYWMRRDPSWHFVLARLKGVDPNDWDRVIQQAIGDLIDAGIPLGRYTMAYIKGRFLFPPDPKDREEDQDQILAHVIAHEVGWLTDLLHDKQRAQAYAAHHWRKVAHGRFSSGPALNMWLRRALNKKHRKMLSAHGRSERSDEG
jgi:hypothetical protein